MHANPMSDWQSLGVSDSDNGNTNNAAHRQEHQPQIEHERDEQRYHSSSDRSSDTSSSLSSLSEHGDHSLLEHHLKQTHWLIPRPEAEYLSQNAKLDLVAVLERKSSSVDDVRNALWNILSNIHFNSADRTSADLNHANGSDGSNVAGVGRIKWTSARDRSRSMDGLPRRNSVGSMSNRSRASAQSSLSGEYTKAIEEWIEQFNLVEAICRFVAESDIFHPRRAHEYQEDVILVVKILQGLHLHRNSKHFEKFFDSLYSHTQVKDNQNCGILLYIALLLMANDEDITACFIDYSMINVLLDLYVSRLCYTTPVKYALSKQPMILQLDKKSVAKNKMFAEQLKKRIRQSKMKQMEKGEEVHGSSDFRRADQFAKHFSSTGINVNNPMQPSPSIEKHHPLHSTKSASLTDLVDSIILDDEMSISDANEAILTNSSAMSLSSSPSLQINVPKLLMPQTPGSRQSIGYSRSTRRSFLLNGGDATLSARNSDFAMDGLQLSIDTQRTRVADSTGHAPINMQHDHSNLSSIEYLKSVAAKLGELDIATDLTSLMHIKRDLDIQLDIQSRPISMKLQRIPSIKSHTTYPTDRKSVV